MPPLRDIPRDPNCQFVRLELPPAEAEAVARFGAGALVSAAAVARVVVGMFARGETVTRRSVLAEIGRIRAAAAAGRPAPRPKRRPGRPRKPAPEGER